MDNPNRKTSGSREESMEGAGKVNPGNVGKGTTGGVGSAGGGSRSDATGSEDTRRGSQTRPGEQNLSGSQGRPTGKPNQGTPGGTTRGQTPGTTGKGTFGSENLTEDDLSTTPRTAGASPSTLGSKNTATPSDLGNRGRLNEEMGGGTRTGKDSGTMRGSTSGTTGFGGEKNRGKSGSPGGVEGVGSESDSADEDRGRQ